MSGPHTRCVYQGEMTAPSISASGSRDPPLDQVSNGLAAPLHYPRRKEDTGAAGGPLPGPGWPAREGHLAPPRLWPVPFTAAPRLPSENRGARERGRGEQWREGSGKAFHHSVSPAPASLANQSDHLGGRRVQVSRRPLIVQLPSVPQDTAKSI